MSCPIHDQKKNLAAASQTSSQMYSSWALEIGMPAAGALLASGAGSALLAGKSPLVKALVVAAAVGIASAAGKYIAIQQLDDDQSASTSAGFCAGIAADYSLVPAGLAGAAVLIAAKAAPGSKMATIGAPVVAAALGGAAARLIDLYAISPNN